MEIHPGLDGAARIRPEERDHYLRLGSRDWGEELDLERWERASRPRLHYRRLFPVHKDPGEKEFSSLEEHIIPFPSAPIFGINRKAEYGKPLEHRPHMHSLRLLRRRRTKPIHRLFVLHNGLNESEDLKFYYRLADWIMRQQESISRDEGVACLVMPFPGHLMHSSFHGPFSETPLSRYLSDAGDLFRQFLKYMVGMRWMLSLVADSDAKDWMVGGGLFTWEDRIKQLTEESRELHRMSANRIARTEAMAHRDSDEPDEEPPPFDIGEETSRSQVVASTQLLRMALQRDASSTPESLRVHVVGYSLGGFIAQSVFFSWPQVVSSCTTICSGGAISALSPTAFAQPEEWQSVLHALRPEMTNSMLQGRLGDDERDPLVPVNVVAGMPMKQYGYFQRIFEQVFLQEDRRSYKERLSEYGLRMLFVSGGEDPIVPPANILDASPREGTTMLSVAGMTHFLNQDPRDEGDRREREQRDFWLPEAGGLIARAAIHAEQVHMEEREAATRLRRERTRPRKSSASAESLDLLTNGYLFEEALDWVLDAVSGDGGWLLLCRNVLPAAFVPSQNFTCWGTGLHHHDLRIQRYTLGLRHRAGMLKKLKDRTTLIVPHQLQRWFVNLSARFDPHSDAPEGRMTTKNQRVRLWEKFEEEWWPCLRKFEAGNIGATLEPNAIQSEKLASAIGKWTDADRKYLEATHLPDVWIGIHPDCKLLSGQSGERTDVHRSVIEGTTMVLTDLQNPKRSKDKKKTQTPMERFEDDLAQERIRMVQISAAEFNPRYQGKVEKGRSAATRMLARTAVGLVRSRQISEPDRPSERAS